MEETIELEVKYNNVVNLNKAYENKIDELETEIKRLISEIGSSDQTETIKHLSKELVEDIKVNEIKVNLNPLVVAIIVILIFVIICQMKKKTTIVDFE